MEEPIYYIIHKVEEKTTVGKKSLKPGYYRFNYNISGKPIEHECQYSKNSYKWDDIKKFKTLGEFQEFFDKVDVKVSFEKMEYCDTMSYRGLSVPVFYDDYGQSFYGIFNNKVIGFGSFNPNYEEEVMDLIDYELDGKKAFLAKIAKEYKNDKDLHPGATANTTKKGSSKRKKSKKKN